MSSIRIIVTLVILCLIPVRALACDCVMPLPEYDQEILRKINVAGHFKALDFVMPDDWSEDGIARSDITLQMIEIYRGEVEGDTIKVYSNMKDGCARYLEVGVAHNLLLYKKEDGYWLADQCTDLSAEGWQHLAEEASVNGGLFDPLSMFSAQDINSFFSTFDANAFTIDSKVFLEWFKGEKPLIFDLRNIEAYNHSHIEGAVHIGPDVNEEKIAQYTTDKDAKIILYCDNSLMPLRRISLTHMILPQFHMLGYENTYMLGSIWQKNGEIVNARNVLPMTEPASDVE